MTSLQIGRESDPVGMRDQRTSANNRNLRLKELTRLWIFRHLQLHFVWFFNVGTPCYKVKLLFNAVQTFDNHFINFHNRLVY